MIRTTRDGSPRYPRLALAALFAASACASSADAYLAEGARARAAGQRQAALTAYHRALEKEPRRADAYLALGEIYLAQEKWSLAVNALREAGRLDPGKQAKVERALTDALYALAMEELRLGNRGAAIESFRELHAKAPEYPKLRTVYLAALLDHGRDRILASAYGEGVEALKEAIRLDPGNGTAHALLDRIRFSPD